MHRIDRIKDVSSGMKNKRISLGFRVQLSISSPPCYFFILFILYIHVHFHGNQDETLSCLSCPSMLVSISHSSPITTDCLTLCLQLVSQPGSWASGHLRIIVSERPQRGVVRPQQIDHLPPQALLIWSEDDRWRGQLVAIVCRRFPNGLDHG